MSARNKSNPKQELVITRIFDTPRDLVWKTWTDPERMKRWWGPKNFTSPVIKIDMLVGGKYLNCMHGPGPDGVLRDFWSTGIYREIVPMERLVMTDSFADEQGNTVPASHYGMTGEWPKELLVTVTFEEQDSRTKMTLRHSGIPDSENKKGAEQGWNESFDKLAESLKLEIKGGIYMQKITPHLWFDNKAEEAANFYVSIFKNSKIESTSRYGEEGSKVSGMPKGTVMTVRFQLRGQEFMALNGGPVFKFSEAISFIVNCDTQEEVDYMWEKLSEGGDKGVCGWLKDKYGLSWQIVPTILGEMMQDKDERKSERVMAAVLKMTKIDIKTLKQAYEQK